jgi:hypothetical protein
MPFRLGSNGSPAPNGHVKLWRMETSQIVALLVAERDRLNNAIAALQGTPTRIGRPPKNPLADAIPTAAASAPKKKRRKFSKAQREAAAERMRQRWAATKKAAAKVTSKPKKAAKAA